MFKVGKLVTVDFLCQCGCIQKETVNKGDKFAIECHRCGTISESGGDDGTMHQFLLQKEDVHDRVFVYYDGRRGPI